MAKIPPAGPNKIDLVIVVNGQPIDVEGNTKAPLDVVIRHALNQSGNSGQPAENWEMRDGDGNKLDGDRKLSEFGFPPGTTLFLSLKAGIGGGGLARAIG